MENSTLFNSLRVVGLTSSFLASGIYFSSSHLFVPLILPLAPSLSVSIFAKLYYAGAATVVPPVLVSAISSAYLSYSLPANRRLYAVAGVATFMSLPWTLAVMSPVINRLLELSTSKEVLEKAKVGEVTALLRSWSWMNHARAAMALVGGLIGVSALI